MTKICALSDLHGHLPKIEPCELVLLVGDIVPLNIQFDNVESTLWFLDEFTKWIDSLPCDEVIMVAGNHDKLIERASFIIHAVESKTNFKLTYLSGTTYEYVTKNLEHYKIYGSPFCHKFGNWAFMHDESYLEGLYSQVPSDIDIWLTHDTPKIGNLDLLPPSLWNKESLHAGGESLAKAIQTKQPKLVVCGHLHTCATKYERNNNTQLVNVSILNNSYQHVYKPTYINYAKGKINILDSHKED